MVTGTTREHGADSAWRLTGRRLERCLAWCAAAVMFAVCGSPCAAGESLRVAVTLSDIAPIVSAVGGDGVQVTSVLPPGADPHSFSLSAQTAQSLRQADLLVCGNSVLLHFEEDILAAMPDTPALDWPQYEAQGARLLDFPDWPACQHGFWLGHDNARAIARAVARKLKELGAGAALVDSNLRTFERELAAMQATGRALAEASGASGRRDVAVVPGVTYCCANLGIEVGAVLLGEGTGFAGGQHLKSIVDKLKSGEYGALVCPLSMRQAKAGEVAAQIAAETGASIRYVRFLGETGEGASYLAQGYYNASQLTSAVPTVSGTAATSRGTTPLQSILPPGLSLAIIAGPLVIAIVMLFMALRRTRLAMRSGAMHAGIFDDLDGGGDGGG